MKRLAMILTFVSLFVGCGAEDEKSGAAPEISDLVYTPKTAAVGALLTVNGTLNFEDPDGDVTQVGFRGQAPDGKWTPETLAAVQTPSAQTRGSATFAAGLLPPSAGTYRFEVWLVDDKGNESNALTGEVEAQ